MDKENTEKLSVHACGCARNRSQETNVLIVSVLFAVVVNHLALRSNAHWQGRIRVEVVGMRLWSLEGSLSSRSR